VNKGDSLQSNLEWEQSRYYYALANRKCIENDNCTFLFSQIIKSKISTVDSLESFTMKDSVFLKLLIKGDSLHRMGKEVYAMKAFDDASMMYPSLNYPKNRITHIINTSTTIQEKLLVLQANQNRQKYTSSLEEAKKLEDEGKRLEAYYRYLAIAQEFHNDEFAITASERIFVLIQEELKLFEKSLNKGNEYYLSGKYSKSKSFFESALSLNEECALCEQRLKYLTYYIKVQQSKKHEYDLQKEFALDNYAKGKYNEAFYQFIALSKKNPNDKVVLEKIEELDNILQSELDEKIKSFNADLLLERANELYMNRDFQEAFEIYIKLDERYSDVINYGAFVKLRVSECLREIEEN
jgi:tetratricopeptide (TPR) repeat protein